MTARAYAQHPPRYPVLVTSPWSGKVHEVKSATRHGNKVWIVAEDGAGFWVDASHKVRRGK